MSRLTDLRMYSDARGNRIVTDGPSLQKRIDVTFRGSGNTLVVSDSARIARLSLRFDCDNGRCVIGGNLGVAALQASIRIGEDASVELGHNVSTTNTVQISAVEGTSVSIGDDVMIAGNVKIRGDDGHPIFDVHSGLRVNPAQSISVGDHVWLGLNSTLLGGSEIGRGSVVGTGAIVTKPFPNNCIVAGVPARIVREDIAWERPHLSMAEPPYKPDASTVQRSPYWELTDRT